MEQVGGCPETSFQGQLGFPPRLPPPPLSMLVDSWARSTFQLLPKSHAAGCSRSQAALSSCSKPHGSLLPKILSQVMLGI